MSRKNNKSYAKKRHDFELAKEKEREDKKKQRLEKKTQIERMERDDEEIMKENKALEDKKLITAERRAKKEKNKAQRKAVPKTEKDMSGDTVMGESTVMASGADTRRVRRHKQRASGPY